MSEGKKPQSVGSRIFRILSGYEIAIICLSLLFLLTFFGTIEQKWIGLYQAIERYFDFESFFVIPQNGEGKAIFLPLPGAYWVMVVLFVNMTLGGLIRIRKSWKKVGVIISHFSILFMLAAGAVSSFKKEEGVMVVYQGQKSDYAQSFFDPTIEVFEYTEDGSRTAPLVVKSEELEELDRDDVLDVALEAMPFSIRIKGFLGASQLFSSSRTKLNPKDPFEKVVDGFFLREVERNTQEELNAAGCYVEVIDEKGEVLRTLVLWDSSLNLGSTYPVSLSYQGKRYGFSLLKRLWPMPFMVELHKSVGRYYPGTRKPEWFQSDITKVDGDKREAYEIVMNDPMRHGGYTLYQAQWTPSRQGEAPKSGFAIVKNPSDRWPEWAFYVATGGLCLHFCMMLFRYIGSTNRKSKEKSA